MPEPEKKYIVIECSSEDQARHILNTVLIDSEDSEMATAWPFLAYDDGFGHLIMIKE